MRKPSILAGGGLVAAGAAAIAIGLAGAQANAPAPPSSTPIKHVVVIFGENESFDHYFGTYPNAANPPGEPHFDGAAGTPGVNGLNPTLLATNPNTANPTRLDRSQAVTCSQNHGYGAEQQAFDGGLMDRFVQFTAGGSCTDKSIVMDYYDGNTVTGLWNLAQHFSLNDNSFSTNFGPSTVGAVNLVSGNTSGVVTAEPGSSGIENSTIIGDPEPASYLDDCAVAPGVEVKPNTGAGQANNVGDLLSAHNVTWGWFEGGFRPTATTNGKAVCGAQHANVAGASTADYIPHHEPFQYYASTANPHHLPPSAPGKIGQTDQANHQYDLADFDTALANNNLPAVSFLKAAGFEDAHPGYSDPLDEQHFVARTLNALEESPEWSSTAVVLAYDDSDGWYDHVMSPIVNASAAPADRLNVDAAGVGRCGNPGGNATAYTDRCGYGPRQPLLVVSPYARQNYVDSTLTDQTSILQFIEDNWQLGRLPGQSFDARAGSIGHMLDFDPNDARAPKLFLDPTTGVVLKKAPKDNPPLSDAGPAPTSHGADSGNVSPIAGQPTAPSTGRTTSGRAARLRLACHVSGHGRSIRVACTATGSDAHKGRTAVRFRIARGSSVLATAATTLSNGRARATLHPAHAIRAGRYTLRIAITRADGVTGVSHAIRLA